MPGCVGARMAMQQQDGRPRAPIPNAEASLADFDMRQFEPFKHAKEIALTLTSVDPAS